MTNSEWELYKKAFAHPSAEEGTALLEQLLRMEREINLLLELAIAALLIVLCVNLYLILT